MARISPALRRSTAARGEAVVAEMVRRKTAAARIEQ
jgi:hypothetical protein